MSQYNLGGVLYRTSREFHQTIAELWLSADGLNNIEEIHDAFNSMTDQELADECIVNWNCLENDDFETEALIEAFETIRKNPEGYF